MSKNHKAWKKLLPCLAFAAILIFGSAMRFPADAISPEPATIQASTGDYFNLAYEKTLEFVQPLWEKVKLFSDQPKDWSEISQNLIKYAKEKPLMAAAVGAGIIWIPFGLFRAFRSKNEEEENSEYDEFMNSEFEEEEEDDYEEENNEEEDQFGDDDEEEEDNEEEDQFGDDDEEEYQKNLREFNEDEEEESAEGDTTEEKPEIIEEKTQEEVLEEAALLEEETEEEVFEDFESESLEDPAGDLLFEDDENDDLLFQDDEDDEFSALRDEEELNEDDEFSDIFSDSTSDDEITDSVPAKSFASDTDTSDDVLKKLENEFASLESEFSEVDDFIDQENKKNESINISSDVDSGSEKTLSHEEGDSSEVDRLLSASESLFKLEDTAPKNLESDPFENKELPSNIMDIINKEAVVSDSGSDSVTLDSSTLLSKKFEIESLEDEEELDQTLKDLQAEMEQTIQEISAQINSEPQYYSETEPEDNTSSDTSSIEDEVSDDSLFESATTVNEEDNDESSLEEILQKAEEEAEKDLKDLLPENNVFVEEEANESTVEEEIFDNQTIPDTVEETFKDVFAEALDTDTFQSIEPEHDLATVETKSEAENVDDIISLIEEENPQEMGFPHTFLAEEKPLELPDLIEESADAFDPLLPALDAATHEEKTPKPVDKQIDSVKANSYIKSLGAFQKNLENRLNTLKYFPPIEDAKPPTPKVQEFEIEEPALTSEPDIDFDHIGESPEKKYSLELMESFILLDNQK
jgi:hypothetical protein